MHPLQGCVSTKYTEVNEHFRCEDKEKRPFPLNKSLIIYMIFNL